MSLYSTNDESTSCTWVCIHETEVSKEGEHVEVDLITARHITFYDRQGFYHDLPADIFYTNYAPCDKQLNVMNELTDSQTKIELVCNQIKSILLEKNKRYGDSALSPINIFSKQNSETSICNRIDDKLSRIKNSSTLRKNDVFDLIGYLTLLCVSQDWDFKDLID